MKSIEEYLTKYVVKDINEFYANWDYVFYIWFLLVLLIWSGYSDPCERCRINNNGVEISCKEMYFTSVGYIENDFGQLQKNIVNINNLNISKLEIKS